MTSVLLFAAAAAASPIPNDYALPQNWLCHPGRRDACTLGNAVSEIAPDGKVTVRATQREDEPKADCFYVYPTLSYDEGGNSDMVANDEERRVVDTQFAPFGVVCRTFAPLYRQSTLTWLRSNMIGKPIPVDMELRYTDVRDAWNYYLKAENQGRPFVLIGHSQGSGLLKRLIAEEIDGKPVQKFMLSAMLAGTNVLVAKGKDAVGDFKATPACRQNDQTGCVMAWVSFRESAPPPANARFGRATKPEQEVLCTNPAGLSGPLAPFKALLPATSIGGDLASGTARWTSSNSAITTRYVSLPGLYSGQCQSKDGAQFLSVRLNSSPKDSRVTDPGGDLKFGPTIAKDWGLHLIDVNLVLGNMVDLVALQSAAWFKKQR